MNNNIEYILCAAIKRVTPKECTPYNDSNNICNIEIGYRHHDILQRFKGEVSTKQKDQEFYTSKGRFVGRYEAMKIAYEAEQVSFEKAKRMYPLSISTDEELTQEYLCSRYYNRLFSEDLY